MSNGGRPRRACMAPPAIRNMKDLKKTLTLDFTSAESAKKTLQTPEVINFLQLPSPELEKFLRKGVAVSTNTPTPTEFLFPKDVTDAQRQYAQGFVNALNQVCQMNGFVPPVNLQSPATEPGSSAGASSSAATMSVSPLPPPAVPSSSPNIGSGGASRKPSASAPRKRRLRSNSSLLDVESQSAAAVKVVELDVDEAQQQPRVKRPAPPTAQLILFPKHHQQFQQERPPSSAASSNCSSSCSPCPTNYSLSPTEQARRKLERKRARNRLAATKCRQRKVDRIEEFQQQVATLELHSTIVDQQTDELRRDIEELRNELEKHKKKGCPLPRSA